MATPSSAVAGPPPGPASAAPADLAVVIVNYRSDDLVRRCVAQLGPDTAGPTLHVLVVDNTPGRLRDLPAGDPRITLIENPDNFGFARGCNQGILRCRARAVLLLNPDTEVRPGALQRLVRVFDEAPRIGAVAPRLLAPDGRLQPSCRPLYSGRTAVLDCLGVSAFFPRSPLFGRWAWWIWNPARRWENAQPMGACLCLRREALDDVGLLDERFFVYFEEVDWCVRAVQRGWRIIYTPDAEVFHQGGGSSHRDVRKATEAFYRSKALFVAKHFAGVKGRIIRRMVQAEVAWRWLAWAVLAVLPGPAVRRERLAGYGLAWHAVRRAGAGEP